MFFVVRSNDSFNFPLGLIKYIVIDIISTRLVILTSGKKSHGKVVGGTLPSNFVLKVHCTKNARKSFYPTDRWACSVFQW